MSTRGVCPTPTSPPAGLSQRPGRAPTVPRLPALRHIAPARVALLATAPRRRPTPRRDASLPPGAEAAITPACPTGQLQASPRPQVAARPTPTTVNSTRRAVTPATPPQAATHPASLTAAATTGSPLHDGFHPIAPQLTSPQNPVPPAEPPAGRFFPSKPTFSAYKRVGATSSPPHTSPASSHYLPSRRHRRCISQPLRRHRGPSTVHQSSR
jgi:hypothetical protein